MPHQCVRCASELPEPLPERCPRCGLLVSRSLPPVEDQQAPSAPTDHQALAARYDQGVAHSGHTSAELGSSSSSTGELTTSPAPQQATARRPLWLPLGIGVLLSSLLLCGLVLLPLGPALAQWGAGAANQVAQLNTGTSTPITTPAKSKPYEFHDTLLRGNRWGWPETAGRCFFAQDGYHVTNGSICFAPVLALQNGEIMVTMTILTDPCDSTENDACVGFWFRAQASGGGYTMALGQTGSWWIGKTVDGKTVSISPIQQHEAIYTGLNVPNTVKLVMRGTSFTVFVNDIQVGGAADATFERGIMAFVAIPGAEVVFSNLSVMAEP